MFNEDEAKRLRNELNIAYGALYALIGIVSQLPGVSEVDIKKALGDGAASMPRLLFEDAKKSHEEGQKIAEIVVRNARG